MYKVIQNNLYLTRGDTAVFPLKVTYMDDTEYTFEEGDKVLFTVKKKTTDGETLFQKEITNGVLFLMPEDTKALPYGRYCYDVQLTKRYGTVRTIIPPHILKICEEVTF